MTTHPSPVLKSRLLVCALCLIASTSAFSATHRRERTRDADQQASRQQQQQQSPPQQRPQRVTRDAILGRLRAAAASSAEQRADAAQSLAAAVRESGVDFDLTPQVEQELREAGATA